MAGISKGRKVGRAAVNALRSLLEDHDHIVQEIDGQNDFGEDLYVTFSENGQTTGDVVKVQVKGGASWRRAHGYAVPVKQHNDTWSEGNIPVLCVVYDPDIDVLYWANATAQLRRANREGRTQPSIGISPNARLDDSSIGRFVSEVRDYVGRFRGMRAIHTHLGEMAGVEFGPSDLVMHFVNVHEEVLIFWKRFDEYGATLLHSDLDWEPHYITPDSLDIMGGVPTVGDIILESSEAFWLLACFMSTERPRIATYSKEDGEEEGEHGDIEADVLHEYVLERVVDRITAEPDLVERSVDALRHLTDLPPEFMEDLAILESDPEVVREVTSLNRANAPGLGPDGFRLMVIYLFDRIYIGGQSADHVRIVWRVPETSEDSD